MMTSWRCFIGSSNQLCSLATGTSSSPVFATPRYGLVWLDAAPEEAAMFIRRFLRHPRFRTKANRMGIVARAHHDAIQFWQHRRTPSQEVGWD
jgi:hypothetical protein